MLHVKVKQDHFVRSSNDRFITKLDHGEHRFAIMCLYYSITNLGNCATAPNVLGQPKSPHLSKTACSSFEITDL